MLDWVLTPKRIKVVLVCEALLLTSIIVAEKTFLTSRRPYIEDLIALAFGAVARGIACKLFLNIANEYRNVRLSRLAWQALAIHAALLFIRGVLSTGAIDLLVAGYYRSPLRGFINNVLGVPSTIFLLLGLVGLLHSYRSAGFRPRIGRRHYAMIAVSVLLFGWMLIFHKQLEQGHSPWMVNRILQPADLFLTAAASIVSIVLHRYALSFNGGKLAESIRWLVIYGFLSGAFILMMQVVIPAIRQASGVDLWPVGRVWALLPWMMTLAAVVRAQMTANAVAQVARRQSNRIKLVTQN